MLVPVFISQKQQAEQSLTKKSRVMHGNTDVTGKELQ